MSRFFQSPQKVVTGIFIALATVLLLRLFVLTIIDGDEWKAAADNLSIKEIHRASPRGSIYDRNGKVLATDRQIFTVKMSRGTLNNKEINQVIVNLIDLLERNGEKIDFEFPIEIEDGEYVYNFDSKVKKWLVENDLSVNMSAETAFLKLGEKYGIESDDRYEIQKLLQSKHNVYPPIDVKNMQFIEYQDKDNFIKSYNVKDDMEAEKLYKKIIEDFEIDENMDSSIVYKVASARNYLKSLGYRRYIPVTIAKDVSDDTVIAVEENKDKLKGVEVVSETKRQYPNNNLASHIIGYMGKIPSSEKEEYEKNGYDASDLVGRDGIEGKFEDVLKGKDGTEIVQVNVRGNYVKTLKTVGAEKGKDIHLTIDMDLQKIAEEALKRNIEVCRSGGVFQSEFGNIVTKATPNLNTGAVVALDVKTGEVLAMASYPDYNPNLFSEGISAENWKSLQSNNPRDSLSPSPMLNMATMTAVQPGSTFKPITAMAGLETGLNPKEKMKDEGFIKVGNRTFACFLWNTSKRNHGMIDMYDAMEHSCNYYFYNISTNKNWTTGKKLNLDGMNIPKILDVAKRFGLNEVTGIEINEIATGLPTEEKKVALLKAQLKNILYSNAENYFKQDVYSNSKRLEKDINTIVSWIEAEGLSYKKMENEYLTEVGVKSEKYQEIIELFLYEFYSQARWTEGDSFNLSIGQGDNAFTPLQMANYMATLGNNGYLNKVSIVRSIEDEGIKKTDKAKDMNMNKEFIDEVKESMRRVTVSRTSGLGGYYMNFPWSVASKTGTAQKSGYINPPSEVEYIKNNLTKFGDFSWEDVNKEMKRLLLEYPNIYASEDSAVRRAVINLSGNRLTFDDIDRYKDTYDEFGWTVALAPIEDPKIAVVCMLPQGVSGGNANLTVREIIGQYLKGLGEPTNNFSIVNEFN